ncbi:polysaccharide biosynthesis protein [Oceanirhabdus sp. W0125-5]|uniref:polysaccharide biosynthesis protein n=1 Tax=Oceanirhabdus sp. W0125-5 TaxID=2999116 RepID=UPI0022F2CA9B|nr:nucleoside-diphosphate sugar epimerase/dehydratase [Oceanirhabdus sp. W0125-5]WBW99432.1 nucleoside-diphosphate sugar epimerase/dehydratase [Oceanirhabdus sp. W0125-5]
MKKDYKLLIIDNIFILGCLYLALLLKFDFKIQQDYIQLFEVSIIPLLVIVSITNIIFNLYESVWKYASFEEFLKVLYSLSISNIIFMIFSYISTKIFVNNGIIDLKYYRFPYSVIIISWCLSIGALTGIRLYIKNKHSKRKEKCTNGKNLLIIGAGDAGVMINKEISRHEELKYNVVGFIDDDESKKGMLIGGIKVLGNRNDIERICKEYDISDVLVAIPSVEKKKRKEILNICKKTGCKLKMIPGIFEIINGNVDVSHIRDVKLEDILGREEVKLNVNNIEKYIKEKVVMITGGGGSIGSELCRQIAEFNPSKILVLEIYENTSYYLQRELQRKFPEVDVEIIIASIRDLPRLRNVFEKYKPHVVFHAAAHKHVPIMELNPSEVVKNNIIGTYNVVSCSHEYDVKRFVLISTDKAVNPTNIYGASKRYCEKIVQAFSSFSKTEFVIVRFGNVLGSNGSIIQIFKDQIASGGPVTLTHPEITRFFMTIPEASQLVIQAGAMAHGGEIFVLDMGEPVKMYDLIKDMIRLSGLEPEKDIKIEIIGLRPGEKLYEELLMDNEKLKTTEHHKIFVEKPKEISFAYIDRGIEEFKNALRKGNDAVLFDIMEKYVETYKKQNLEEQLDEAAVDIEDQK